MDDWDQLLELAALEAGLTGGDVADRQWVPLAQAGTAAGVSRSALRAWYRNGDVASRVVDGPHGPQRLVDLDEVVARAEQSPRIRRKVARRDELEELRSRVAELERRLAALEGRS
ncbi:MAG: excisionase [Acidimicrobiia bacterium]